MHHLRLALATRCLHLSFPQVLRAAAAGGVPAVQFDVREELRPGELTETGIRQLLHHLDELGLRVASTFFPTRRSYYEEDQLDARVAATRIAMKFAWQLKSRVLVLRIGRIPQDEESKDRQVLCDVINDLARYGNQVGVSLALTPTHDSIETLATFVSGIQSGPVGVNFDPAAFLLAGESPAAAYRRLHNLILHVTARDAIRDIDGTGIEVPVGRGEVDWVELLALLEESAFSGWTTVVRTQGEDKAGDVLRAVQYLKNVGLN
jgi:sugar phosphate isomerase/epimerase